MILAQNLHIEIVRARNGQLTAIALLEGGKPFYLHSSVDPKQEAENWIERVELTDYTLFLVMGVGVGYHVAALLERLPAGSHVLVLHTGFELELLRRIREVIPMEWLNLDDGRLSFLQLTNMHDLGVVIGDVMLDKMVKSICLCRHFPTMRLDFSQYKQVEDAIVVNTESSMSINFNVSILNSYHFFKNYWKNFPYMVSCCGIRVLKDSFRKYPVIVVAAGPSLDKNVRFLKECKERVIVIAAGTAVSALMYHGIQPDFVVFSDPMPENYALMEAYTKTGAALVASTMAVHKLVANFSGPVYFFQTISDVSGGSINFFEDVTGLRQTVSVATAAVDYAVQCGAKTVILIGQDLAFEKEKEYAQGTCGGGYENAKRVTVEGYYGGKVLSTPLFKAVIDFYNQYVAENKDVRFINATEGGALISAMQQDSLYNVMNTVLPQYKVDKRFIKKLSSNKRKLRPIILDYLHKMHMEAQILSEQVAQFIQANDFCNDAEKVQEILNKSENIEERVRRVYVFFEDVARLSGYKYIEKIIRPRLALLIFQKQDGMPIDIEYQYCNNLLLGFQELLTQFLAWTRDNITTLQTDNGGTDNAARN